MPEAAELKIEVGAEVRVHFHPSGSMKSFCEGVVSRVDVTTREGRFFVVDVMHEVILDREHPIRRGFQDFVRYDCPTDFPGRIELLSTAAQDVERNLASDLVLVGPTDEPQSEVAEQHGDDLAIQLEPETEQPFEAEITSEPAPVDVEPHPIPKHGGLLAALFGRGR